MVTPRPTVFCNPFDDAAFRREVERLVVDAASPEVLQERLREAHPSAVVRARDLSNERFPVWYVYRDGHWVPNRRDDEDSHERSRG